MPSGRPMDKARFCSLLVLCVVYLWIADNKVAAKCSGRWAIHACGGGNGKRSDPSSYDSREQENVSHQQLKLHDLLNIPSEPRNIFPREEALVGQYKTAEEEEVEGKEQSENWVSHHDRLHRARTLWQKLVKLLGTKSSSAA